MSPACVPLCLFDHSPYPTLSLPCVSIRFRQDTHFSPLQLPFSPPKWVPTYVWNQCNPKCGPGVQQKVYSCIQEDRYNTSSLRPERFCGPLPAPTSETQRSCNWGECGRKTFWRASNWSDCSQPCGDRGLTTREVECVMSGTEGDIVIGPKYENAYCNAKKRPESTGVCNRFNCPAEFQAMEWQKVRSQD